MYWDALPGTCVCCTRTHAVAECKRACLGAIHARTTVLRIVPYLDPACCSSRCCSSVNNSKLCPGKQLSTARYIPGRESRKKHCRVLSSPPVIANFPSSVVATQVVPENWSASSVLNSCLQRLPVTPPSATANQYEAHYCRGVKAFARDVERSGEAGVLRHESTWIVAPPPPQSEPTCKMRPGAVRRREVISTF